MRKYFLIFALSLAIILPLSVNALTNIPITISDNEGKLSAVVDELSTGEYILPEFCSNGNGCTIAFDQTLLKQIGKYNFGSGSEYFFIFSGIGATIYEESGANPTATEVYQENFNKIVFDGKTYIDNVVIQMGAGEEERMITFVPTKAIVTAPIEENTTTNDLSNDTDDSSKFNLSRLKDYTVVILCGIGIILITIVVIVASKKKNKEVIKSDFEETQKPSEDIQPEEDILESEEDSLETKYQKELDDLSKNKE